MSAPRVIGGNVMDDDGRDWDNPDAVVFDDGSQAPPSSSVNNPLDQLRSALQEEVQKPPVTFKVASRRNVSVRYNINLDIDQLQMFQQRAMNRKTKEVDAARLAVYVLSYQCESILFNDVDVTTVSGEPMTFRSKDLRDMMHTMDQPSTIKKFFSDDSELVRHFAAIVERAGYDVDGSEPEEGDDDPFDLMLERIEESQLLHMAAIVAERFKLDPVSVAAEPDMFSRLFRVAASNYIGRLEEEARNKK